MKKIYFILVFIIILLASFFIFKFKDKVDNEYKYIKENNYNKENMEPISKENALRVLKSKYGDGVSNTEEDIKLVGDEYLVDVHIKIEDEEDIHQNEKHEHNQSMGIHKINIYSGEIVENK
ncbi:MAG: hypothetical protein ACRCYC_16985 [Paraclostridium sp.]|uniref:hypothetical protein n=1 Tax=Paraclostridium sp. TaxID=2023273 RepID=UPI003F3263E6